MLNGLYNTDVLTLSANLKVGALAGNFATARKVSKLCGSWIEVDIAVVDGRVSDIALRIEACAWTRLKRRVTRCLRC